MQKWYKLWIQSYTGWKHLLLITRLELSALQKFVSDTLNSDTAKKEIDIINTHRGPKQKLADVFIAILTVGLSLIYKACKGYSLFNVKTNTQSQLDEFKESVSQNKLPSKGNK